MNKAKPTDPAPGLLARNVAKSFGNFVTNIKIFEIITEDLSREGS